MNIIEDGETGLPETAQQFKDWYDGNMSWLHTEIINGDKVVLMPAFDFNVDEDEFLDVDLDKAYCVWCGAKETHKAQYPQNHLDRMLQEKQELDLKLSGLKKFLSNLGSENSPLLTDEQVNSLELQSEAMEQYSNILESRIEYDSDLMNAFG